MPKREEKRGRLSNEVKDSAWMVVGLLIGWVIGAVIGQIYDRPLDGMAGGAVGGALIGAIMDFILKRRAAKLDSLKPRKRKDRQK